MLEKPGLCLQAGSIYLALPRWGCARVDGGGCPRAAAGRVHVSEFLHAASCACWKLPATTSLRIIPACVLQKGARALSTQGVRSWCIPKTQHPKARAALGPCRAGEDGLPSCWGAG